MAESNTSKGNQPPVFGGDKTYDRWKIEIEGWQLVTSREEITGNNSCFSI